MLFFLLKKKKYDSVGDQNQLGSKIHENERRQSCCSFDKLIEMTIKEFGSHDKQVSSYFLLSLTSARL